MAWLAGWGTRGKLFLGFGVMWLMLAAVVIAAYLNIMEIVESQKELREVGMTKVVIFQRLRVHDSHNRIEFLELMDTGRQKEQEEHLRNIQTGAGQIDTLLDQLLELEKDNQIKARLLELKGNLAQFRKSRAQVITLVREGKLAEARQVAQGAQDELHDRLSSTIDQLTQSEEARLDSITRANAQRAARSLQVFVILGVIAFLLGVAMTFVLNHTVNEVVQVVNQLATTGREILTASSQVAAGSAETAAAISQTTATVAEVRQAAELSSKKAQDVSAGTQGVVQVTKEGQKASQDASQGLQQIRREMESIAKTVVFLSEQGQSIGGIIATVTDLADQSNLLAVNAAIEAAKAGEQGKGFGVVAQEIKSLAEQSKQATSQVRDILAEITRVSGALVMASEQGGKAMENALRLFTQAGLAIEALSDSSVLAAQAATQIAVSSQQQLVGMDQVGQAMENINQAGSQTAVSMKQVETAAQDINQLGLRLSRLVLGEAASAR